MGESGPAFRFLRSGICESVTLPRYGRQDLGYSPGGAMDCFSLQRGNLMLGNPAAAPAWEMIVPPEIEFTAPGWFVLTGARHQARLLGEDAVRDVEHSRAYRVQAGDRLVFGKKQYGLRAYFCFRVCLENEAPLAPGPALPFASIAEWADPQGRIRVLPGPEHGCLENGQSLFDGFWRTTAQMDKMGIRLCGGPRLICSMDNMISAAVADGTVQWTPDGPIILLRHRQTIGGYPRIFNVITADIDLLGQYGPNERIRFRQVGREKACEIARQKQAVWERIGRLT
jgi:allophanate hydrolase subunit 2